MTDLALVHTREWATIIKRIVRSEMALHDVTYAQLSQRLENSFGIRQTESNLKAKINKGVLGAQLFVQILNVLGTESLDLAITRKMYAELTEQ